MLKDVTNEWFGTVGNVHLSGYLTPEMIDADSDDDDDESDESYEEVENAEEGRSDDMDSSDEGRLYWYQLLTGFQPNQDFWFLIYLQLWNLQSKMRTKCNGFTVYWLLNFYVVIMILH